LIEHVRVELPLVKVPLNLPSILETTYRLVPYSSKKSSGGAISPIFGLPLETGTLFFCDCGKGYFNRETLRTHQTRSGERACSLRLNNPGFHQGYGQRLTSNQSFFEVDPRVWRRDFNYTFPFALTFSQSLPPLRDYSKMKIKGAEDEMNTSSYFYTQRWLKHLEGFSPEDIGQVTLTLSEEASFGDRLRQVAEEFLKNVNRELPNNSSFGILKLMGQTTEYVFFSFCNLSNLILYLGEKPCIGLIQSLKIPS
jgi:hypothetical protein